MNHILKYKALALVGKKPLLSGREHGVFYTKGI